MEVDPFFKVAITLGEVLKLVVINNGKRGKEKLTKVKLAENILTENGLSLVPIPDDPSNEIYRDFQLAKEVVRNSLNYVIKKWQKSNYQYDPQSAPHDIFFDLSVSTKI